MKFHLAARGHKGRDATIGNIKARCYWLNYYNDIKRLVKIK